METANSSSERVTVDRLAIARLGQRGDGIADTADGPVYVPYTLPGETVETESWPGHPDRRHLVRMDVPSPQRIAGARRRGPVLVTESGTKDILQVGVAAASSHHIVPIDNCPILAPGLGGALE